MGGLPPLAPCAPQSASFGAFQPATDTVQVNEMRTSIGKIVSLAKVREALAA